jgi:hypothetical protein
VSRLVDAHPGHSSTVASEFVQIRSIPESGHPDLSTKRVSQAHACEEDRQRHAGRHLTASGSTPDSLPGPPSGTIRKTPGGP